MPNKIINKLVHFDSNYRRHQFQLCLIVSFTDEGFISIYRSVYNMNMKNHSRKNYRKVCVYRMTFFHNSKIRPFHLDLCYFNALCHKNLTKLQKHISSQLLFYERI